MDLNKAMIIGRLTRDPETRTTPQGITVCSFGVATNLIWRDAEGQKQEKVEYHNVVTWRKLADICSQYLRKGSRVYLEGRLQTREWEGQDGVKRLRTEIIADNMIMLDSTGIQGKDVEISQTKEEPIASETSVSQTQGSDSTKEEKAGSKSKKDEISIEEVPF